MPNRVPKNRTRFHKVSCPICDQAEIMETAGDDPKRMDHELTLMGWQWSTQITEPDHTWHLVCPKHYAESGARTILKDAETNPEPVEIPVINGDSSP